MCKCKKSNFLSLCSRACDGNYCLWQVDGKKREINGYMPDLPGLTNSDGCDLTICLECGRIDGINLKLLRKQVESEFADVDEVESEDVTESESESESESEDNKKKLKKKSTGKNN